MATVSTTEREWKIVAEHCEREGVCLGHGETEQGFPVVVIYGQSIDEFIRHVLDLARLKTSAEDVARAVQQSLPVIPDSTNPMN